MPEKMMTLHPAGKAGTNIDKGKYEQIKGAILTALGQSERTFTDLAQAVDAQVGEDFEGSVMWYVTTVKLDLEARGMVERIPKSRPQKLRIVETP